MVQLLYGPAGCGKSTEIYNRITEDLKNKKKVCLIVPEQTVLYAERCIADLSGNIDISELEVLSFKRLCNRIFREYGGLSYNSIDDSGKLLVMWKTLHSVSSLLKEYNNCDENDKVFVPLMVETIDNLKQFGVSSADLELASKKLEQTEPNLSVKAKDIALIYTLYNNLISAEYNDPQDELTKICDILCNHGFFEGYNVYFDAFDGYTYQQYNVISEIIRQAENVIFSFCFVKNNDSGLFSCVEKTYNNIVNICKRLNAEYSDTELKNQFRFLNNELKFISENLWNHSIKSDDFKGENTHVYAYSCYGINEECEAIINDILKRVRQGSRYRDFAVYARDISQYKGYIDRMFERHGIPYFMSKRTDIKTKPVFKLIISAFAIKNNGWKFQDVISYAKTGLAGISYEDCDLLENYVSVWNINGSRWTDGIEWNMNPDGFAENITDEGKDIIFKANEIREKIVEPLVKLFDSIGNTTVRDICTGIFNFLEELHVRETIKLQADNYAKEGNDAEKGELSQLWNILMNSLDNMVIYLGDDKINSYEFQSAFEMLLSKVNIGNIPSNVDEVILGNSSGLRSANIKTVYLLGVNEGEFPKTVVENSVFNDKDIQNFKNIGIEIDHDTDERTEEELFWFYKALSSARENIVMVYASADYTGLGLKMSTPAARVCYLLNKYTPVEYSKVKEIEKIWSLGDVIKHYSDKKNDDIYFASEKYIKENKAAENIISNYNIDITAENDKIVKQTADIIFPDALYSSPSKIESYNKCHFNYFCNYVLNLNENKKAILKMNDLGSFMHEILERVMAFICEGGKVNTDIDNVILIQKTDEIIDDYVRRVFYNIPNASPRMLQLIKKLRKTTLLLVRKLIEEFSQSDYIPKFFELPIGKTIRGEKSIIEPYCVKTDDGTQLFITGVVDRVDTFKKNKDVFVRVIDYKTGIKNFNMNEIEAGINLQMLLYLFAIWNTKSSDFKKKTDCQGEIIPAGVLYYPARMPYVDEEKVKGTMTTEDAAMECIKMKGLLLDNMDSLEAMEHGIKGVYIPAALKKEGGFNAKKSSVTSLEELGKTKYKIDKILINLTKEIKKGNANAKPLKDYYPCGYCAYKPLCRKAEL